MNYYSTRDITKSSPYSSAQAIKQGLANDGGLFVPETIPALDKNMILELCQDDYATRAAKIMKMYLDDYTYEELLTDCQCAYADDAFPGGAAPLVCIEKNLYSLELWHGPTAAFKDMALQIMPRLLSRALKKTGETRTALILVATSGDTGKAALEGYRDIDQTRMIVFYPVDGVSRVQKLQMATQRGDNVQVFAIRGNFDDAQTGVKQIFNDVQAKEILNEKGYFLSSANSINWGRLLPQIVYYISAYCDLLNQGVCTFGEETDVCVPTGNFGNIFASYLAKKMGLPIRHIVCASNKNHILTDFFKTGCYDRNREFHLTMSPSMDILISSNLERLLYFVAGSQKTVEYMKQLNDCGKYTVEKTVKETIGETFTGLFASEEQTSAIIQSVWKEDHYLSDTHTAVALHCAKQFINENQTTIPMIVASTANPYKFANNVYRSITGILPGDDLAALNDLENLTAVAIPYPLADLASRPVRFREVIEKDALLSNVLLSLNIQK